MVVVGWRLVRHLVWCWEVVWYGAVGSGLQWWTMAMGAGIIWGWVEIGSQAF